MPPGLDLSSLCFDPADFGAMEMNDTHHRPIRIIQAITFRGIGLATLGNDFGPVSPGIDDITLAAHITGAGAHRYSASE